MRKILFLVISVLMLQLSFACGESDAVSNGDSSIGNASGGSSSGASVKTGRVTFYNVSSYRVKVHRDSFSGPVVAELGPGSTESADVRISDSHGFGTTFSVEYLYRIGDVFDAESGDVFASLLDFDVQINFIIEEGKTYTQQIPQPANLEPRSAFIEILNANTIPCQVMDYGRILRQAGNNTMPIPSGKIGVFKLEGIPAAGETLSGYKVVTTFAETPIPEFQVQNGYIYRFTYNGSSVVKTGEQTIVF